MSFSVLLFGTIHVFGPKVCRFTLLESAIIRGRAALCRRSEVALTLTLITGGSACQQTPGAIATTCAVWYPQMMSVAHSLDSKAFLPR
jgi:hypothetical protein